MIQALHTLKSLVVRDGEAGSRDTLLKLAPGNGAPVAKTIVPHTANHDPKAASNSVTCDAAAFRGTRTNSIEKILVTGGTGFIGGAVLAELIDGPLWPKTLIMVRAANAREARTRIVSSLLRFLPGRPVDDLVRDEQIIVLGLEDASKLADDPRIRDVSHVIHSAAVTAFSNHPRIRAINVDASMNFVNVLKKSAKIQRFVNVGTAWCVGMDVDKVVLENGEQGSATHIVPYTESKLEFERTVRRTHPDFPFVSARPSIVVGHTRYGTTPSGSIYWVFRSVHVLGQFSCDFDQRLDVVPVDWVARSLVSLMIKPELSYDTYHLSAGEQSFSTIAQLDIAIASGREVRPVGRDDYRAVSERQLTKTVYEKRKKLGDANPWLLSRALGLYAQFAESGVVFDNQRTMSEGIEQAPPFHTYAAVCARTSETASLAAQMADDFK